MCLPPPAVFLSLSRSPHSASLPPVALRALSLPIARSLSSSLSRQLPRARKTAKGRRVSIHRRACARSRARSRRALFESCAGFSRVSSRGNSAGNVESGIAWRHSSSPPDTSILFFHLVLVVVVLRVVSERVPRIHGGCLLSATRRRAAPRRASHLVFPYNLLGSQAFFSFTPFSYLLFTPPPVATLPLLPFAPLSSPLFSSLSSSRSSILCDVSLFSLSLPPLPPPSLPPCLYLCLCPPVHIPLPLGASHESSIGPGGQEGCVAHRPFNSVTSTSSIHRASIYQWQVKDLSHWITLSS